MSVLNVKIPEHLHDTLRIAKVKEKREIGSIVTSALENYFSATTTDPPAPHDPTPRR